MSIASKKTVNEKSLTQKKLTMKKLIIIFSVLAGIVIVVLANAYANNKEIEKQMYQNLENVAKQNAEVLKTKIYAQYKLLNSLSNELYGVTESGIKEKLAHFEIFLDEFHLKRFAICLTDGTTYSTDGDIMNLSYREFYKRGMEGKCSITGILYDAINEEHSPVNVMTIPLYDGDGKVSGVFGLTYDTEKFNESLQISSYEGKGYSCIINYDAEIMAVSCENELKISHNFMEDVLQIDSRNEQVIEQLQQIIENNIEGNGVIYLGEKQYYYVSPVELMDGCVTWYIMTMVPSEILEEKIIPIQRNQYLTVFFVILFVMIGVLIIITYIKDQQKQILQFAYEDPLTKGANYIKFYLEMENKVKRNGSLIVMDIANFNNISVVAGEESSDAIIKETWNIISSMLNQEELAAHISDDNFMIFLLDNEQDKILQRMMNISDKISDKAKNFEVYGIQARYGIYMMTDNESFESAYNKAKIAREFAVVNFERNYALYSEVDRVKLQREKQLEDRFPDAFKNEEFEVWYQPKYSAENCTVVGSEALVRWRTKDNKMISPGEFIPLFERNGMIVKLDEYMFRMVCRQQKKWLDEGKDIYPVSVNISRASLYCIDVHKRYYNIMQEYMLSPEYIQLEVTETVMEEKNIQELLNKFRKMGIKISMDDFGTGYSALSTLSRHCFDTLKLDKTLIDHIGDEDGETMLYHIIKMGQQMGLHITAEGVEEHKQLKFLQDMKCDDIQGFYFSKPIPENEFKEML